MSSSYTTRQSLVFLVRGLLLLIAFLLIGTSILLRSGGVVPEDFVDSTISADRLHFSDWRIYGHKEWAYLANKHSLKANYGVAEIAAKKSLMANPSYGYPAVLLMNIYVQTGRNKQADYMRRLSKRLWPPRHAKIFGMEKELH